MGIVTRTATVAETASGTSVTGTLPADRQAGDLVVATFHMDTSAANFTAPAGWTQLCAPIASTAVRIIAAYYRFDPPSGPVGTTAAAAGRQTCICQAYGGVDPTTPVDAAAVTATSATAPLTIGQVTATADGARLISAITGDFTNGTWTQPSGMTLVKSHTPGTGRAGAYADENVMAGPTGTNVWTATVTTVALIGFNAALRPVAVTPAVVVTSGVRGYQLAADWSRAGTYDGTLENVTSYVPKDPAISVEWGRSEPRADQDTAAGKMTFALNNHGRQFSPENTASPIAGRVLPGTPARLIIDVGEPPPVPVDPNALPKAATLTETFRTATVDTAKWGNNTASAYTAGWRGRVIMPATAGPSESWSTENGGTHAGRYDLTSSHFGMEWAELPTATGAVGVHAINSLSPENRVVIGREGGNLLMRKVENGTVSDTTLAYDPVFHRWVRLTHDGTSLLWQTSSNGITWTTRRTTTTTIDLTSVFFTAEATWQTTVGTGRFAIANVNTAPVTALTYNPPPYHFGTLRTINDTYTDKADDEYAGGNRVGMYEVFWDRAEGAANGTFSSSYATQVANETATIRAAGLKLTLGLGLTYPPTWTNTIANYRFVNESAANSTQLNYVFNQLVRDEAEDYFDWVNSQVGFTNCWSIRINAGTDGELLYPSSGLWGYDLNAKGTAGNLPATVAPSPYPTWTPGTGTTTQAGEWMEWYLDSLADCAAWQMRYLRDQYGYNGWFEILTPGSGTRPSLLATETAARFTGYSATTGVGAVWHKVYQKLAVKAGVVVYCSSMADNSGTPTNDVPTATDVNTAITSSTLNNYSAYRWLVRVANEFGMPNGGENPGRGALADSYYQNVTNTGASMMWNLLQQSAGGKALATYWAHSDQLWGGSTLTFANWSAKTAALNTTGAGTPPNPPA